MKYDKFDEKGLSLVISALLLVAISVATASAYYWWFTDLQLSTNEIVEESTAQQLHQQFTSLQISAQDEYYFKPDTNGSGEIDTSGGDERFIQDVEIEVFNNGDMQCDIELQVVGIEPDISWRALHIDRDNDYQLLYANDTPFNWGGSYIYFGGTDDSTANSVQVMTFYDEKSVKYYASNGTGPVNTTNMFKDTEDWYDIHDPDYNIGKISPRGKRTIHAYILISEAQVPSICTVKLRVHGSGKDAYKNIIFNMAE